MTFNDIKGNTSYYENLNHNNEVFIRLDMKQKICDYV